jgi:hypothetical protein
VSALFWRIRHPLQALRHWLAMRRAEKRFGPFGKTPF